MELWRFIVKIRFELFAFVYFWFGGSKKKIIPDLAFSSIEKR